MENAPPGLAEAVTQFRRMLPAGTGTARAIDEGEPWSQIARKALLDGYVESADDLWTFIEVILRHAAGGDPGSPKARSTSSLPSGHEGRN